MRPADILLVDFNSPAGLSDTLELELCGMTNPPVVIHHKAVHDLGITEAIDNLSAAVASAEPDLLILLLTEDAQASAPGFFRALLGQKRCPPILAVPGSEELSDINALYQ